MYRSIDLLQFVRMGLFRSFGVYCLLYWTFALFFPDSLVYISGALNHFFFNFRNLAYFHILEYITNLFLNGRSLLGYSTR